MRLTTPQQPGHWEETSQDALRVEGEELLIALPQGWRKLRLHAPEELWPQTGM